MKSDWAFDKAQEVNVAPFTGAWIEIMTGSRNGNDGTVAPFTGAWIEISSFISLPRYFIVAPFTGAWIEITITAMPISSS